MENTYGYKPLSYALIDLFRSGAPDFAAAEELLRQGADINDQGYDKDENVLSEILIGYWQSSNGDGEQEECHHCTNSPKNCSACEYNLNPDVGESMIKVIKFFLDHGFDVNQNNGKHGAQCLWALTLSTFDRYLIDATKLLLDAGAQNISIDDSDADETPRSFIGTEGSYQDTCQHDHYLGNIYEATYQIYLALEDGIPYSGIDSFEKAIGKKILYVMAEQENDAPVFSVVDTPESKHQNCFNHNLYFVFEGGYLVCTEYASYWVDTLLPRKKLVDVTQYFEPVISARIESVNFEHKTIVKGRTHYGQPITTFSFDNGEKLTFTTNFGEVERGEQCSYYYFAEK